MAARWGASTLLLATHCAAEGHLRQPAAPAPAPAPSGGLADFPGRLPKDQPFPRSQFKLPFDDSWPRTQSKWRQQQQKSSVGHNKDLNRLEVDDEPDTYFWREPAAPQDDSEFWTSLCEGVAKTGVRKMDASVNWLDPWGKQEATTCYDSDLSAVTFASEVEAVEACGSSCAAILDVGCGRKTFRTCKMGYGTEPSADASCLRAKPPNYISKGGMPRGAREDALWAEFCAQGNFVQFKLVFKQRACAAAQNVVQPADVPPAQTEAACAELVVADAACSEVFDFAPAPEGEATQCRCTPKEQDCKPTKAAEGQTVSVYIIEKVHGGIMAPAPAQA